MQKVIFMDIDGTLVNDHGIIPNSAKVAVQRARENGHLVFICTGRSKAELFPEILEVGFDGIIGAAGGYIEVNEKTLVHERVATEDVEHLITFFDEQGIDFYLESNGGLFASRNCKQRIRTMMDEMIVAEPHARESIEKGIQPFHDALIDGENLLREDINKISFLGSDVPIDTIKAQFESKFTVIPSTVPAFGNNSGELSIPGINKALAIEKLLGHLSIGKEHTLAYGDGLNDLEMLEYVAVGVAMGNAKEALKQIANDITDTHDGDGIYNSFKKYGLL